MPTISPSAFKVKPGGNFPSINLYWTTASVIVLDAETFSVDTKLAFIVPKLPSLFHVITLSISPMIPMVNVLEVLAESPLSPNLTAVMVKL